MKVSRGMAEVLLLLLAYGLLLEFALMEIQSDVGELPSVVRRRALAGLVRRRAPAAVLSRAAEKASRRARQAPLGERAGRGRL